jgi:Zn-dependent protease with chaperone function
MDFFEHQEHARRRTRLLLLYFVLALAGIVAAVYGLAMLVLAFAGGDASGAAEGLVGGVQLWNPGAFALCAGGTGSIVGLASTFKSLQLSGGGAVVARELGGREIDPNTTDFHERRLLNLVEEMAIASGLPVPSVYVMDAEDGINAFAAGRSPSDAVVGFTRGCMTQLSRDELQGVVAHEFSHILNGDMRLNIRLMGLLFGILFLALVGEFVLRNAFRAGGSSRKEGAGAALLMLVVGIGLLAIGYAGSFFAKLIKASVSRQREYLADAAAVQFTRNPEGIGGALRKIGALAAGSRVTHPMAEDASHLFFGSAFQSQLFATHPPLAERIRRILPQWDGSFEAPAASVEKMEERPAKSGRGKPPRIPGMPRIPGLGMAAGLAPMAESDAPLALAPEEASESLRSLHPEQVELGEALHDRFPAHWFEACRTREGAQAVVYALLLSADGEQCAREFAALSEAAGPEIADRALALSREFAGAHSAVKIGLVDLSIPALRHLGREEYEAFRANVQSLVESDGLVDLFEFMLLGIVTRHLDAHYRQTRPAPIRHHRLQPLLEDAGVVLSTLAAFSHPEDPDEADRAFGQAAGHLRSRYLVEVPRLPAEACGLARIETALAAFAQATPTIKRDFLEACSLSVMADGALGSREAELIRAAADAMGCPIPPFVRTAPRLA